MNYLKILLENKYDDIKDKFTRLKYQLSEKLSKFDSFLLLKKNHEEKGEGRDIVEKHIIEKKLKQLDNEIEEDIKDLEKELKAQKKNKKFHDIDQKEKIFKLLNEKINILQKKYKGEEFEEELDNYQQNIVQLDDFLKRSDFNQNSELRELYEEEKNKIDEWKGKVKIQDEKLEEVRKLVKDLKIEAEKAGDAIKGMKGTIKSTDDKITTTTVKVQTQNERVKDLLNKIRTSDKICCDIVLILIVIGLICVLYSVIKHKY